MEQEKNENLLPVSMIEEVFLPVVNTTEVHLEVIDNKYSIAGIDDFINRLNDLENQINEYTYHEDDRKNITKLKAETNKYIKLVNDEIKQMELSLFSDVKDQKKLINEKLNTIVKKLQIGLDEENEKFKAEKKNQINDIFSDALNSYDDLKELDIKLYHIEQSDWLNRSKSFSKISKEIDERLNTISSLLKLQNLPTTDMDELSDALYDNNWDGLQALNQLIEDFNYEKERKERLEREHLEKLKELELKKLEADKKEERQNEIIEDVTITIKGKDWLKAESILKVANIEYTK